MKKLSIDEPFEVDGRVMVFVKNNGKLTLSVNSEVKKKKNSFVPPTADEVMAYFKEKGYQESAAAKFHEYYDSADWKDGKGNQVKNWKQKAVGVWFREENKIVQPKLNDDSQKINFFQDGR